VRRSAALRFLHRRISGNTLLPSDGRPSPGASAPLQRPARVPRTSEAFVPAGGGQPRSWARLEIPRLGLSAIVLEGSDSRTLRLGIGRISGTGDPGQAGNSVLSGNRAVSPYRSASELRQALLTALDESVPRTLSAFARSLGYTNTDRLYQADRKLCHRIAARHRQSGRSHWWRKSGAIPHKQKGKRRLGVTGRHFQRSSEDNLSIPCYLPPSRECYQILGAESTSVQEQWASVPPSSKVALKGALRVPTTPTVRVAIHPRRGPDAKRKHQGC